MSDFDQTRLYADIADRDDEIKNLKQHIAELEQRENELAAYVEQLSELFSDLVAGARYRDEPVDAFGNPIPEKYEIHNGFKVSVAFVQIINNVIEQSPHHRP